VLEWRIPISPREETVVLRHLQKMAVTMSLAGTGAVALVLVAGAGVADAATRFRTGRVRASLLSTHVAPNGSASSGLHLTGPDVMAAFVGLMAVLAFVFLVVTFIRRRVHSPLLTPGRAA
jgi:hypothetical protein